MKGPALADPSYGTLGRVELVLGAEVFSRALLRGRQVGPLDTPTVLKMHFGWVLAGEVNMPTHLQNTHMHSQHGLPANNRWVQIRKHSKPSWVITSSALLKLRNYYSPTLNHFKTVRS